MYITRNIELKDSYRSRCERSNGEIYAAKRVPKAKRNAKRKSTLNA